jgi:hypothetical protein
MVKWIIKINWRKVFLCGLIYTLITTIIHFLELSLTMKYYLMAEYYGVWSKLMMPNAGPPTADFFITLIILTFVSGISLSLIYYYIRDMLPKYFTERVFFFADLCVGFSFIFFTLPAYLLLNIPVGLLVSWFISNFIILVSAAFILVKIIN